MELPTFPPTSGATLKARRDDAGVSQEAIAFRLNTTRQAIGRWERKPEVRYVKARKYLDALEAEVADQLARGAG